MSLETIPKEYKSLKGILQSLNVLNGTLSNQKSLSGTIINTNETPVYNGDYDVIPSKEEQVLHTKQMKMKDDVIVREIPYVEVTNTSNGITVTIGKMEEN